MRSLPSKTYELLTENLMYLFIKINKYTLLQDMKIHLTFNKCSKFESHKIKNDLPNKMEDIHKI